MNTEFPNRPSRTRFADNMHCAGALQVERHEAKILAANGESVEANCAAVTSWQQAMKRAIRSGQALCEHLGLPRELACTESEEDFPVFAPLEYVSRMQLADPHDPLLLQVLGGKHEIAQPAAGLNDPVGDLQALLPNGLLQKYEGRVLLITHSACAIHCRYCFRRQFPYEKFQTGTKAWEAALSDIQDDATIDEVILSGGDPLTLTDPQLTWLFERLNAIEHIHRIRLHTRVPVVIPQRVTAEWCESIHRSRAAIYVVLHFNHRAEWDMAVHAAMNRLRRAGATLLNQAVLLRGINDSADAQLDLCRQLIDAQILPYYLHQLDRVVGATHFEVEDARAREIMAELRARLPGYAVPRLVREIAGQPSKTPIESV